jgi:hypothetical protein
MTNWVIDTKAITYPNGVLTSVAFRQSETGEIQISTIIDVDILNLSLDDVIRILADANSKLLEASLHHDSYFDNDEGIIVETYVEGWRTELSEFEKNEFAENL